MHKHEFYMNDTWLQVGIISHSQGQVSNIAAAVVKGASSSSIDLLRVATEVSGVLQGALECHD